MKVTRIAYSHYLNPGKYAALNEQARRLGAIRSEVWQRYGSVGAVGLTDRQIRDQWLAEGRPFEVSANAWKETLRDAMGDLKATQAAAKEKVRCAIGSHTDDPAERKRFYALLKSDRWVEDGYLRRIMRKSLKRGHNHTHNQIIVRSDNYATFQLNGKAWIKIPGLEKGRRIAIPLTTRIEPTGTLRLILREGDVEVHYTIDVEPTNDCGGEIIGLDKGYSEAFVDSDGQHHGGGLGKRLADESDFLKTKHQRRAKLRALAEVTSRRKRHNIIKHNLGCKKAHRRARRFKANVRDVCFKAAHAIADKASTIAAEDLTSPIAKRNFGKNMNRRLAAWTKGLLAEALHTVSQRRGSTLVLVNAAYTSQIDSRHGVLMGRRVGDRFHCFDGVVLHADENAARNVKARLFDPEIDLWTPFQKVKSLLLARTERLRLGLLNQDPSCAGLPASTGSESPMSNFAQ